MTNLSISQLPAASTITGTELVPIVQAGQNVKALASALSGGGSSTLNTSTLTTLHGVLYGDGTHLHSDSAITTNGTGTLTAAALQISGTNSGQEILDANGNACITFGGDGDTNITGNLHLAGDVIQDGSGNVCIQLDGSGNTQINNTLTVGTTLHVDTIQDVGGDGVVLDINQSQIRDNPNAWSGALSIDFGSRILYGSDGATANITYNDPYNVDLFGEFTFVDGSGANFGGNTLNNVQVNPTLIIMDQNGDGSGLPSYIINLSYLGFTTATSSLFSTPLSGQIIFWFDGTNINFTNSARTTIPLVTGARTLTINGTTQDLSSNRSWTIGASNATTVSVTSNVTLTPNAIHFVNTNVNRTLTFPSPGSHAGCSIIIKDIFQQSQINPITVARASSEKIEGISSSMTLNVNGGYWQFTTDGTDWFLIG